MSSGSPLSSKVASRGKPAPGGPWRVALLLALPMALILRAIAFRLPDAVERWYSQGLYPWVAALLGAVSGAVPFSLAEALLLIAAPAAAWAAWRAWHRARAWSWRRRIGVAALVAWTAAGLLLTGFLLSWGLNYARPSLAARLELPGGGVDPDTLASLAERAAAGTARLHAELGGSPESATELPLDFGALNAALDAAYDDLALPGDRLRRPPVPAKALWASPLLSRLGISGIFIPFTGEPSVNGDVPSPSLPTVVAHEKAHQRGITDEGEANLAAVMACLASPEPYLRYAAHLEVAARLIGAVAGDRPERAAAAWDRLGPGARADLAAIREFWERYRGVAQRAANRVNDAYLRSNRVPDGVRSYGRVVDMLVDLDRAGRLALLPPAD